MKKNVKMFFLLLMSIVFINGCSSGSQGDKKVYPQKPIQVIVPYPPGGGSDILTRAIMKYIDLPNDQKLVAVSISGASGYVGAKQASTSKNDGYTILAHNPTDLFSYTLNGTTEEPLWDDLVMISTVVNDFSAIVTNPKTGWKSIEDVAEYAKANPGEIKWGITGYNNVNFGDSLRTAEALGIKDYIRFVPYDGDPTVETALRGDHIQLGTYSASVAKGSSESGDVVPLLVIGNKRAKALPNTPSTEESGFDILITKPRSYYAPKGTDPAIIKTLSDAFKKVTENPEFAEMIEGLGQEVYFVDGEEMQIQVKSWVEELQPVFDEMSGENNQETKQ